MPRLDTDWTVERINQFADDGNRYEVIDGELFVTPAPNLIHQRALAMLHLLLGPFAEAIGLDMVLAPFAVTFSEKREVQPDLLVMPRKPDGSLAEQFIDVGQLLLAVEALSPSTKRTDRTKKRDLYQREHLSEYWIVDTDARAITRGRPNSDEPELLTSHMQWQPLLSHDPLLPRHHYPPIADGSIQNSSQWCSSRS